MVGETVLHYQITEKLGQGGMGVVYKATDLKLLRIVALKFIPDDITGDADANERFLREARAASALDHPNVGTIFGVEQTPDGRQFIVMAFYEGETLGQVLRRGPLSRFRSLDIARQVAGALGAAHGQGIIHRDVKPGNVIFTKDGTPKLVDFGLASVSGATRVTQTGAVLGTPHYMSPEQAVGEQADARSDLWALGVILAEMLTARTPFEGASIPATLYRIVHEEPAALDEVGPELKPLLQKALAKDPDERFQTAKEMADACEEASADFTGTSDSTIVLPGTGTVPARPPSWRKPTKAVKAAGWPAWKKGALTAAVVMGLSLIVAMTPLREKLFGTAGPKQSGLVANPSANQKYMTALPLLDRWEKGDNLPQAIALLQESVRLDPKFALGHARLADAYRLQGTSQKDTKLLNQALQTAELAVQLGPELPPVHTVLGRTYSALGNNDLALASLNQALKLDANDGEIYIALGRIYEKAGKLPEARASYERGLTLAPDDWRALLTIGNFYFRRHEYDKAIQSWQRLTELTPDNAPAFTNLGAALMEAGRLAEAQTAYQKAIAIKPNYTAYMNLGKVYWLQARFPESAGMFEQAVKLSADDYVPVGNLAAAYFRIPGKEPQSKASYATAAKMAERAAAKSKGDPAVHCDLATYYARLGRKESARSQIATAIAIDPKDQETYAAAAEVMEVCGDRAKAVEYARRALELGYAPARFQRNPELKGVLTDPRFTAR